MNRKCDRVLVQIAVLHTPRISLYRYLVGNAVVRFPLTEVRLVETIN